VKLSPLVAVLTMLTVALDGCDGGSVKGNAARGAELHNICLDCHGTELYARPDRKVKSKDALRKELLRWGDYYNPALTEQDIDDLFVYLNTEFYRF
jgi:mono/diheme cytochrome c family protein